MSEVDFTGRGGQTQNLRIDRNGRQIQQRRPRAPPRAVWKKHQQLVPSPSLKTMARTLLLVVAASALVYVSRAHADGVRSPKLPDHVADVRDAILTAARSGDINELKSAFEVSGNIPDLGVSPRSDPIKVLKDRSADPQGRDTLAAIVEMLEMPPSTLPFGNDIENNLIYVWPYISTRQLDKLTPAEEVDLYRLVTPELAEEMRKKKRWLWWRLVISADGTWMLLRKGT